MRRSMWILLGPFSRIKLRVGKIAAVSPSIILSLNERQR